MKPIYYLYGGIPALIVAGIIWAIDPELLTFPVWIGLGLLAGVLTAAAVRIFNKDKF